MAATASAAKISTNQKITSYHVTAEGPADVAWVDFQDFEHFLAICCRAVGTGGLDALQILGNTAADGSGTDVVIADEATAALTANAVNDNVIIECSAEGAREVAVAAGHDIRGISVSLGHATLGDDTTVTYVLSGAKHPRSGLTANVIA